MSLQGWLSSRRLAVAGIPLLALVAGAAAPVSTFAVPASALPIQYARSQGRACAATPVEADSLTRAGAAGACAGVRPESFADLASQQHQMVTRRYGPFSRPAPGAYRSAVAQAAAVLPAGSFPGTGNLWKQAGASPDCDGQTSDMTICPLSNQSNPNTGPNTGDYAISTLGHRELSGRVTSFAGDPANYQHVWISPVAGGVFESRDSGAHWHDVGLGLPTQEVGAISYSAATHTLIAGTGDNAFGGDSIAGPGIYWSADDGGTWTASSGVPDPILSFRIVVSPADSTGRTIYAATSRGLLRSNDGGRSFINENLPSSPAGYTVPDPTQNNQQVSCQGNTTAPLCFFANIVTDVVVKGSTSSHAPAGAVMAVLGWRAGAKGDKNADGNANMSCQKNGTATQCLQAPQNGLYESDTGAPNSFTFKTHAGSMTAMDFAADAVVGRTSLGIADGAGQSNDYVVALVQDAGKFNRCVGDAVDINFATVCQADVQALGAATVLDGLYATTDFGGSWVKIMDWSQLRNASGALLGAEGYAPGVQSWYNNWVKPDPTATDTTTGIPTRVVFGLEEVWENNQSVPKSGAGAVPTTPWLAYANGTGPSSAWADVGRYWNACGGLNATGGVPCSTSGLPSATSSSTTHPDQHAYLFQPDGSGGVYLYVGNDGGAYVQHVASGGDISNNNWGDGIDVGLYTLQPYDAISSADGTIVAGLQDNGETKIAPDGSEQHTIFGGDGFFSMIDPANSQNIIESYVGGSTSLSIDGGKNWYGINPGCPGGESAFSTPMELDPVLGDHAILGCTQIQEAGHGANTDFKTTPAMHFSNNGSVFMDPCYAPMPGPGENPFTCQQIQPPWTSVYDLGLADNPGVSPDRGNTPPNGCGYPQRATPCVFNVPSAVNVRDENMYVGYCGYCDVVTGGLPFASGIATNVGGSSAPKIGASDGWHIAGALCAGCGSSDGKLPQRLITSIQQDPADARTVYVTLGGYGRHWIPPGALGDDVSKVGKGHVFVSHDAAEHFTDISGNLPDIEANFTMLHKSQLVVATDLGVFVANSPSGGQFAALGTGLPLAPVFTLRLKPGDPDTLIAATYGRGVQKYKFAAPAAQPSPTPVVQPTPSATPHPSPSQNILPNSGREMPSVLLLVAILASLMGGATLAMRKPRQT